MVFGLRTTTVTARRVLSTAAQLQQRHFSQTPAALGLFKDYVEKVRPSVKEITAKQLNAKITSDPVKGPPDTLHIFDVRETYEWNEEHIPYAVYTGRGTLERDIEGMVPDPYDEVILYCAGGPRSIVAADTLQKMGYKNVHYLSGGIGGWKQSGLPVSQNFSMYSERVKDY
ncbi:hypothetical protein HK102_003525 [Quaeritorhiza haematococci]|nr:hypothetical protein HK102_003525 [Quaeritorhiza haematococci]